MAEQPKTKSLVYTKPVGYTPPTVEERTKEWQARERVPADYTPTLVEESKEAWQEAERQQPTEPLSTSPPPVYVPTAVEGEVTYAPTPAPTPFPTSEAIRLTTEAKEGQAPSTETLSTELEVPIGLEIAPGLVYWGDAQNGEAYLNGVLIWKVVNGQKILEPEFQAAWIEALKKAELDVGVKNRSAAEFLAEILGISIETAQKLSSEIQSPAPIYSGAQAQPDYSTQAAIQANETTITELQPRVDELERQCADFALQIARMFDPYATLTTTTDPITGRTHYSFPHYSTYQFTGTGKAGGITPAWQAILDNPELLKQFYDLVAKHEFAYNQFISLDDYLVALQETIINLKENRYWDEATKTFIIPESIITIGDKTYDIDFANGFYWDIDIGGWQPISKAPTEVLKYYESIAEYRKSLIENLGSLAEAKDDIDNFSNPMLAQYILPNGGFDLAKAAGNVPDEVLMALGFSDLDIARGKAQAAVAPYIDSEAGTIDLPAAYAAGLEEELRLLGFTDEDFTRIENYNWLKENGYLVENPDGTITVNYSKAIADGVPSTYLTNVGIELTETEYADLAKSLANMEIDAPELYQILITQGIDAYNAEITRLQTEYDNFIATHTEVAPDVWFTTSDANQLEHDSPELYNILATQGYDAYLTEIARLKTEYDNFINTHPIELSDGSRMTQTDWDSLTPEIQNIALTEGGAGLDRYYTEQAAILAELKPYASVIATDVETTPEGGIIASVTFEGTEPPLSYDILAALNAGVSPEKLEKVFGVEAVASAQKIVVALTALEPYKTKDGYLITDYLLKNPENAQVLLDAGFSQSNIEEALAYINLPWVKETSLEKELKAKIVAGEHPEDLYQEYFGATLKPEILALKQKSVKELEHKLQPELSLAQFIANFLAARDTENMSKVEIGILERLAEQEYVRLYGASATAASATVASLAFVLPPARVLYPEVKIGDIKAIEWAIGAAQVALLAAPMITAPLRGIPILATGIHLGVQAGAGGIFTVATVQNWKYMNNAERAISVLIDIALLAPVLKASISAIKAKVDPLGTAAKQMFKTEVAGNKAFARRLETTYGKDVADAFKAMNKAQTEYINQLIKLEKLELAGKIPKALAKIDLAIAKLETELKSAFKAQDWAAAKQLQSKIKALQDTRISIDPVAINKSLAIKLAESLEAKGAKLVETLRGKVGYDVPTLDGLPQDLVRNSKLAVEQLKATKVSIKALKADVARTGARLNAAQNKYPTDPSKWTDLVYDHIEAQIKLAQAQAKSGSAKLAQMYDELLKARAKLKSKLLTQAEKAKLQLKVTQLENKIVGELKRLEIVETKPVIEGKGGTKTIKLPEKLSPTLERELKQAGRVLPSVGTGGGRAAAIVALSSLTRTMTYEQAVKEMISRGYSPEIIKAIGKPIQVASAKMARFPIINPIVRPSKSPVISPAISPIPFQAPAIKESPAIQPQVKVLQQAQVQPKVKTAESVKVAEAVKALIMPKIVPAPMIEPLPEVKPAPKTGTPVKTPEPFKPRLPKRKKGFLPPGEDLIGEQRKATFLVPGSVAWQQGFGFWVIKPPYKSKVDSAFFKGLPPKDVIKVVDGMGEAYRSIQALDGVPPDKLFFDMGIMDVTIAQPTKEPGKQGAIQFVRSDIENVRPYDYLPVESKSRIMTSKHRLPHKNRQYLQLAERNIIGGQNYGNATS